MRTDPNGTWWLWDRLVSGFKTVGNAITNFFVNDIIKPAADWVGNVAVPSISNFFTNTVPDFFTNTVPDFIVNTVWNGGIVTAWNTVSDFFTNTVWEGGLVPAWKTVSNFFENTVWNDWIVDKVWNKGLGVACNWIGKNWDDILLWGSGIIGAAGVICLFIPGAQLVGGILTVLGFGLSLIQIVRRYS